MAQFVFPVTPKTLREGLRMSCLTGGETEAWQPTQGPWLVRSKLAFGPSCHLSASLPGHTRLPFLEMLGPGFRSSSEEKSRPGWGAGHRQELTATPACWSPTRAMQKVTQDWALNRVHTPSPVLGAQGTPSQTGA